MLPYYAFALVFLTLYGFTLAYAFANAIAGGALAITALTAIGTPLVLMDAFQEVHYKLLPLASLKALLAAMAIAGGAYALKLFSERGSRAASGGRKLAFIAAAVLSAPLAVTFLMLARFNSRAEAVIMPAPGYTYFSRYNTFEDPDIFNGAAMFQRPFTGELFLADASGKKAIMVQGSTDREKGFLYLSPYMRPYRTIIAAKDGHGKAWVLYGATAALTRVFNGDINGFKEYPSTSYNYGLTLSIGKKKGLLNFRTDGSYFADLEPGMKGLEWRKVGATSGEGARYLMKLEDQKANYLTADRRTGVLSYNGRSWKLPSGGAAAPIPLKGSKEIAFIVNTGAHKTSYICLPGEKPAEFAPTAMTPELNLALNPDGSVWGTKENFMSVTELSLGRVARYDLTEPVFYILTADRKVLKGLKITQLLKKAGILDGRVKVVHAVGDSVWFNLGDKYMARVDGNEAKGSAQLWRLPEGLDWGKTPPDWSSVTPSPDGIYVAGAAGLFFIEWSGRLKKLD